MYTESSLHSSVHFHNPEAIRHHTFLFSLCAVFNEEAREWETVFNHPGLGHSYPGMLVLVLLYTVPVTAADIDISVEGPGISNWGFISGTTNINSTSIILNVSSVSSTWTVSVKDNLDFSKPPSTVGKMVEWDGSAYVTPSPWVLGTAMNIAGPSVPSKTTGASVTLDGSEQIIESGLTPVTGLTMPLTISQPITYSDPVLKGGHLYQVIVTYIAFAEGGPAPVVTGIVPAEGIIGTTVTITDLSGSNFLPHSVAVLNRTGSPDINLTGIIVTPPTKMTGTFNIRRMLRWSVGRHRKEPRWSYRHETPDILDKIPCRT